MIRHIRLYFRLLRCEQWVKNLLIFFPLFFSLHFTDWPLVGKAFIAFIAFSFAASSIYIFNDLNDIEHDRNHPRKKNRPLASGTIPVSHAIRFMIILAILSLTLAFASNTVLGYIIILYLLLNIAYCVRLKHSPPLDIFLISASFVLRLMAGTGYAGVGTIIPSHWILVMTFLLALFLAFAKRRDDVLLAAEGKRTRKAVDGYNLEFINSAMSIMASVIIVAYLLYTLSPDVAGRFGTDRSYITVVFVILGLFRYLQITFVFNKSGSPTEVLLKDRFLQFTIIGWILCFIVLIY